MRLEDEDLLGGVQTCSNTIRNYSVTNKYLVNTEHGVLLLVEV
jgi:hypothetical protein